VFYVLFMFLSKYLCFIQTQNFYLLKNIDVLNRLMHTMELLENNQIHCHNLMTVSDVTIKAQINQLQAEFVNILQEIKDLHKNLRELFR